MIDRFQFRTWITIPLTQEDGEEFDFNLYLYGIDILSDGNFAGFEECVLSDILAETKLTDKQKEEVRQFCEDNNIFDSDTYYCIPVDIIEQCTALNDKNDKLIYEGDILKFAINDPEEDYFYGVVRYSSENWKYEIVVGNKTFCLCQVLEQDIEVIGNVHANSELLEGK